MDSKYQPKDFSMDVFAIHPLENEYQFQLIYSKYGLKKCFADGISPMIHLYSRQMIHHEESTKTQRISQAKEKALSTITYTVIYFIAMTLSARVQKTVTLLCLPSVITFNKKHMNLGGRMSQLVINDNTSTLVKESRKELLEMFDILLEMRVIRICEKNFDVYSSDAFDYGCSRTNMGKLPEQIKSVEPDQSMKKITNDTNLATGDYVVCSFSAIAIKGTAFALGKMAFKFNFFLLVLLLCSSFHVLECGKGSISIKESLSHFNSHQSEEDLLNLVNKLVESRPLSIQLLYEKDNEERAFYISKELSIEMSAVATLNFYHYSNSSIDTMINTAIQGTSVMTLCSFPTVLAVFEEIKAKRILSQLVNWIMVFRNDEVKEESLIALQSLIFEGTHVTIVGEVSNGTYLVYSANVEVDGIMRFTYKGQWRNIYVGNRPQLMPLYDPNQYLDMKGRQLRVAANDDALYMELGEAREDGSFPPLGGLDFEILESLKKSLNFTYKLVSPPDGAWGYPQPDGTITGLIGMAARREVHLAVTGIAMNAMRNTVIDYSNFYKQGYMCIFSKALAQKNREFAIFTPFSLEVWICIIVSALAIGPLLKSHSAASNTFSPYKQDWDLQTYSFNTYRSLVMQGNPLLTTSWSQRLFFFSWYFFCLIIYVLYSGQLTSSFAVPSYEKPIDSLEDLPRAVEHGFTLTLIGDTTIEYMFKEASDGIMKQTWDLFNHADRSKSFLDSATHAMRLVLEEKSIHIEPCPSGKIISEELGKNRFYKSRDTFFPQQDSFALPKGSPYRKYFDKVILKMLYGGLVSKWNDNEIEKIAKKAVREIEESRKLVISLVHLQAAFFLLLLGYSIAAVVLLAETLRKISITS